MDVFDATDDYVKLMKYVSINGISPCRALWIQLDVARPFECSNFSIIDLIFWDKL